MEERTLQPNQLEGPATVITEAPPSQPPQAPSDDQDAPALFFSDDDESDDDGEFEFPFVSRDSPAGTAAPADELFADGRIRPFYYPVFGHGPFLGQAGTAAQPAHHPTAAAPPSRVRGQLGRLFLEESRARNSSASSTSSSEGGGGGGLDGAPPESYCLWTPGTATGSPRRPPRKSGSTGSMARWRRISELVVGRSHSDGKEKFMFFPAPPPQPRAKATAGARHDDKPSKSKAKPSPAASGVRTKAAPPAEVDAAVHRVAYGGVPSAGGTPRRTFLPYREELVGFFANVNGVSRSHQHPF